MFRVKIKIAEWKLILLLSLFMSIVPNLAFWKNIYSLIPDASMSNLYFYFAMLIFTVCILNILLTLVLWKNTFIIPILLLLLSASFGYFSLSFNIYVDLHMLLNIMETNTGEAIALMTPYMIIWIVLVGILPSIFLLKITLIKRSLGTLLKIRIFIITSSIAVLLISSMPIYNYYASFFRNNNQIIKQLTPSNYIVAGVKYLNMRFERPVPYKQIGLDAKQIKPQNTEITHKPKLMIFVLGETSRAQNFSLNGYEKLTNPKLAVIENLINFEQASSCATATAISVPCMFSNLTREHYNPKIAKSEDNVLDILSRVGVSILWRENDEGCKGVCDNVLNEQIIHFTPESECPLGLCYDEHLLSNIEDFINKQTQDTLIVLHTNGSHGPSYYQRYPPSFPGQFKPACETNQIQSCDKESLINTYDNTILYVDTVLDKTIDLLLKQNRFVTSMLYLSDHGESLGENGLYLHAAPYMIAPKEQTHIPFMFWFSDSWVEQEQLDLACWQQMAKNRTVSHDNLFHSLLGLFRVQTEVLNQALDLSHTCLKS
ncbi:phosphoethanolamine transferase [Thorsellia anophelis]|nr:phosphoethanolamine--lipid A transferase [Thorsellia anophelis]